MLAHLLDFVILGGFLALNLAVGLYYGRSVKTFRDYALGGQNFPTPVLTASICATLLSASYFINALENSYTRGVDSVLNRLFYPVALLSTGYFFVVRIRGFLGDNTIAGTDIIN